MLNAKKLLTNSTDVLAVANDFVVLSDYKQGQFRKFIETNILPIEYCGKCEECT